jgi:DHA1 family bicyclomycin/chloramphenicol resistance-like MFS transporter
MVVVVPTLGALARDFGISFAEVQFLISAYLFGLGASQPFSGLLCDRLGRRPVLLGGFVVFVLASIGCALAASMPVLILLRFLQAVGVSVGTVASRAIVRDTHDEAGTARALATIAAAMGIAPVIAPVIGGLVVEFAGPQAVFLVSAALGALTWLCVLGRLDETRPPGVREASRNAPLAGDYRQLLGSRVFMGYSLMFGFVQGGFFCFLAVGAAVFEADLGMGPREFGLVWGVMAIAYVAGAALANPLTARLGMRRVIYLGLGLTLCSGWGTYAAVASFGVHFYSLVPMLALLTSASGLVIPGSMAGAVSYRPEIAGTSSGLSSALGLGLSGAFSIVAGVLYVGDFTPVALLMGIAATLTAVTGWMIRTPRVA